MEKESTSKLYDVLKKMKTEDVDKLQSVYVSSDSYSFISYMDHLIQEKNLKRNEIILNADLPQKYGYKLLSGETHTKDRDKLIRLFIAMGLTLKEAQKGFTLYGLPILYPKFKRDALFIIAFNEGITSVDTLNQRLLAHNEPELTQSTY